MGCSSEGGVDKAEQHVPFVMANLDYTDLSPDGTKCDEGSSRPCFQPIRKRPERSPATLDNIMNAVVERPEGQKASWPIEPYKGVVGDMVKIVCQVLGEPIRGSRIWDVVEVPAHHMNNETLEEIKSGIDLSYGVVMDDNGEPLAAYGYMPDRWVDNPGVKKELKPCTPTQNPEGFAPVV